MFALTVMWILLCALIFMTEKYIFLCWPFPQTMQHLLNISSFRTSMPSLVHFPVSSLSSLWVFLSCPFVSLSAPLFELLTKTLPCLEIKTTPRRLLNTPDRSFPKWSDSILAVVDAGIFLSVFVAKKPRYHSNDILVCRLNIGLSWSVPPQPFSVPELEFANHHFLRNFLRFVNNFKWHFCGKDRGRLAVEHLHFCNMVYRNRFLYLKLSLIEIQTALVCESVVSCLSLRRVRSKRVFRSALPCFSWISVCFSVQKMICQQVLLSGRNYYPLYSYRIGQNLWVVLQLSRCRCRRSHHLPRKISLSVFGLWFFVGYGFESIYLLFVVCWASREKSSAVRGRKLCE